MLAQDVDRLLWRFDGARSLIYTPADHGKQLLSLLNFVRLLMLL